MTGRGLRSVLQPVLFFGIASMLHGMLFLIPGGGPGGRDAGTSRGIRVKTYVEGPRAARAPAPPRPSQPPAEPATPSVQSRESRAVAGSDVPRQGAPAGGSAGDEGGPSGASGPSQGPDPGSGGGRPQSEFGEYLEHLRSDDVQGWARRSAKAARQGWKGSGAGAGSWGTGTGSGSGSGSGSGRGTGSGAGRGDVFMDPRVRMVVVQYAGDGSKRNIEGRFRPIPYPDLKVKKSAFTSGWWNVYIELWTTQDGRIAKEHVLRPETEGPLERVFVDQVKRELEHWTFDPGVSEIHVDVRFYVE